MPGKLIALIYFYLISAVSIGLLIFGVFSIGNLVINLTQYDKYPLKYGIEQCDFLSKYPVPMVRVMPGPPEGQEFATPSAQQLEDDKRKCLEQAEYERKQHKLDDIKNAVLFTLIGAVLFLIHYPLARKHSS